MARSAALAAVCGVAALLVECFASAAPAPGEALAPFTVRTAAGAPFHWKPGKATVVSFCAFWCDTWKQQLPRVTEARQALKGLPVEFMQVSVDGEWLDRAKGSPGKVLADPGGAWTRSIGIDRVPYTLVVDERGVVRWASFGIVRSQDLIRETKAALRSRAGGLVYLTFDDFPAKALNDELLDSLRAADVRATFFCIGSKLEANARVAKRAAREGHSLQIHSWAHSAENPRLKDCRALLKSLTGAEATLYRPPGSEKVIGLDGSPRPGPVSDPYDFYAPSVDEIYRRVTLTVKPGSVIQLHAGMRNTLAVLPRLIANLRGRGFSFAVLR